MTGQEELQQARDAGFTDEELGEWLAGERESALAAGFSADEFDAHWGRPPFHAESVKQQIDQALKTATTPTAEGAPRQPVTDFMGALKAGFGESSLAMLMQKPTTELAEDAPRASRIAAQIGTMAGDVPAMIGGFLAGGGPVSPVTGMAGAFAVPPLIRRVMADKYEKGEVSSFADFWDRFSGAFIETAKGYVTGLATGAAGKAIARAPIASPAAKAAATLSGEVATMVTVGKALEGQVPEPNDFVDTAIALGFVKGSVKIATKLRRIYVETGVKPETVAQDVRTNPTIAADIASDNVTIPRAYRQPTAQATEEAPVSARPKDRFLLALRGEFNLPDVPEAARLRLTDQREPMARQDLAVTARHETPIDQNAEMLARAEKAMADVEMAGQERGTRIFQEQQGRGATDEVIGLKSATAEWYKEATTGDRKLSRARVETALQKILDDNGRDVGSDVQRVKELILGDREFESSPFMPRTEEEWGRARQYAMVEWEPDVAMAGGAPPKPPLALPAPSLGPPADPQAAVLARIVKTEQQESVTLDDLYTSVFDSLHPINVALKGARATHLPTGENPLALERLTRGTYGKGDEFIKRGAFDFETYKTVTRGYKQIMEKVEDDLDGFRAYIVAKRAIEKEGRGIATGVPLDAATEVVRLGSETYETVHRERVAYRNALLDYLKQSGIVSEKAVSDMREANKDYVPFYRFFEDEQGRPVTSKGVGQPIRRMTGSERQILDPIVSDIKDTFLFIGLAERNAARQAYIKVPGLATKQDMRVKPIMVTEPEIKRLFNAFVSVREETAKRRTERSTKEGAPAEPRSKQTEMIVARVKEALTARGFSEGESEQMLNRVAAAKSGSAAVETVIKDIERTTFVPELNIRLPHEAATLFRAMREPLAKDEIAVFTEGKREVYKVDPKVAEAFDGIDRVSAGYLTNMLLYTPASLLRAGVVITPDFIGRNVLRDAVSSFIYAGSNPIKTALGLKSILTQDTAFQNWMKGGGANATMVAMDRDYIQRHIMKIDRETGLLGRAWNVARTPLDLLRATSELIENSTRLGSVRSELLRSQDKARIQALSLMAREATVDFARHGRDTQEFSRMTAFFNPALQGIDRFARASKDHPMATMTKALGAVTLPSLLLWYANKDDKEIENLPRWQKDLFWVTRIPLPDGGSFLLRIPKAHEIGLLFGTLPERLLDQFVQENPDAWKGLSETLFNVFLPSMVPTAAVPVIGQFANRDTFTDMTLIPAHLEKLLPEYQYTEYTTETAKAIGHIIGSFPGMEKAALDEGTFSGVARALTTPVLIENYVRSWTGGMGMYLLKLADQGLREAKVLPDPVLPARTLADIPVVKAFIARYPAASAQSIQDFYDAVGARERIVATIRQLARDGDPRSLSLLDEHEQALVTLSRLRQTLTEQGKLIRDITKNPDMTASEKRQLIDTLYYTMIEISRSGMRAVRETERIGRPAPPAITPSTPEAGRRPELTIR